MWDIVWVSPQGHTSVSVSRHFLLQAPQCPCSVRKRFSRDHCCRGRSKPGCRIVSLVESESPHHRLWLSSSRYTVPRTRNKLNDKSIFCCWTHDLEQPTAVRSWLLTAFCVAHFFGDSWISFVLSLSVLSVAYMHVTNVKQMTDFIRT